MPHTLEVIVSEQDIAVVVGVGPGLGRAVARRFARAGMQVGLVARSREHLEPVAREIEEAGGTALVAPADATEPDAVRVAFDAVRAELGTPTLLVYNAGAFRMGGILEVDPDTFEQCWRANCHGAYLAAREVLPGMLEQERGTILLTGATASLRGKDRFAALAVGKFGLRALGQSMAREFGPRGIHVAHVVVDGQIDTPTNLGRQPDRERHTFLSAEAIAESYWSLHAQDPTAWTHELDLRPAVEPF